MFLTVLLSFFTSALICSAAPTLEKERCGTPGEKEGAILQGNWNAEQYSPGTVATFTCVNGYIRDGPIRMACIEGSWLDISRGQCKILGYCSKPQQSTENGQLVGQWNEETFSPGKVATYICHQGYSQISHIKKACIEGEWITISKGQCIKDSSCGPPPKITNGVLREISKKATYLSGERVTYECARGYTMGQNANYITCEDSVWTEPPICRKIGQTCGAPPVVQFGDITEIKQKTYQSGSSVIYKCANYYKLEGKQVITCRDGEWEKEPVCRVPCTVKETDMQQNNIQLKYKPEDEKNKKIYSEHLDWMSLECKSGYQIFDEKLMRIQCLDGVLKYPRCLKEGSCVLQQTEMALNNIHYNKSTEIENGQTIQFECVEGMVSENDLRATCGNTQINYPKCSSGQPCTIDPSSLKRNNIELLPKESAPEKLVHGAELNVKCKANFKRQGFLIALCYDGVMKYQRCFSGGTCRIIQKDLDENFLELDESHENEVFFEEGETISFKCKTGYRKSSGLTGTCTKSEKQPAEYTLTYPTCRE